MWETSYSIRADIQTDMKNIVDDLRNFAEAHNNTTLLSVSKSLMQPVYNSRNSLHCYNFSTVFEESRTCDAS